MMDNLRVHKPNEVVAKMKELDTIWIFFPPYSPFLQPIELCFSKVKCLIKQKLSGGSSLFDSIETSLSEVTTNDCMNWFIHTERFFTKCLNEEPIINDWRQDGSEIEMDVSSGDELLDADLN